MRDLDQLHEHGEEEGAGRKAAMLAMAGLATVTLVFAMGVLLGGAPEASSRSEHDPLEALDDVRALEEARARIAPSPLDAPTVDPAAMQFHEALVVDARPEVEAALAQAAAEAAQLGAFEGDAPSNLAAPAFAPAGDIALAPTRAAIPVDAQRAEAGADGSITIQVSSYRTKEEADIFAEALRARGHRAFVMQAEIADRGIWFRVRIGPFDSMREAENYRATFEQEERMNSYVVRRRN